MLPAPPRPVECMTESVIVVVVVVVVVGKEVVS